MRKHIAIIEGNHEGLVGYRDGSLYGAAEGFADTLQACAAQSEKEMALDFTIIRPHFADHHLSSDMFDDCDGVVFTGSANRWSADEAEAAPARQVMARALDTALPVFGSCYGLQLAVAVLGGENRANPKRTEFAIARDITLSAEGKTHALYQGKVAVFDARCMHRDEIARLPSGAVSPVIMTIACTKLWPMRRAGCNFGVCNITLNYNSKISQIISSTMMSTVLKMRGIWPHSLVFLIM